MDRSSRRPIQPINGAANRAWRDRMTLMWPRERELSNSSAVGVKPPGREQCRRVAPVRPTALKVTGLAQHGAQAKNRPGTNPVGAIP